MKAVVGSCLLALGIGLPSALPAAPSPGDAPVAEVIGCRTKANDAERLRCYDAAALRLADATASGSVVVVDREEVRRARRSLFGFSLPKLPFFKGDRSQEEEEQEEVTATIKSVRGIGDGKWQFDLDTAGVWQTTEASSFGRPPRAGETIKIKKSSLGSYFLTVTNGRARKGLRIR